MAAALLGEDAWAGKSPGDLVNCEADLMYDPTGGKPNSQGKATELFSFKPKGELLG